MSKTERPARVRNGASRVLLVLGCLLLLLANLAVWVNRTVVSTDGWVDTVGPLSQDDDVAVAVSEGLTRRLAERVDFREIAEDALPDGAEALIAPLGQAVRGFVADAVHDFVVSDRFNQFWERANELAHAAFIRLAEDKTRVGEGADKVVLKLEDVLATVDERLQDQGIDLFEGEAPPELGDFELFGEGRVERFRFAYDILKALEWVLPVAAVLVFAGALGLSTRRRRMTISIGIGVALTMALAAIAVRLARNALLGDIENEQARAAANSIWDHVRTGLVQQTGALFMLGVLVALGFWITGPSRRAVRLREWNSRQLAGIREGRLDSGRAAGVGTWLGEHRRVVQGGALALVILVLLLMPRLSALNLLVAAVLLAAFVGAVELLAGPRPAEATEPPQVRWPSDGT